MTISLIQHTQGVYGYQYHSTDYCGNLLFFTLSKKAANQRCPDCDSHNVTATHVGERIVKGLPTGTKQTRLKVKMHRIRCHDCSSYKMEKIDFIPSTFSRVSKCLIRLVIDLRQHMCIKSIARFYDLDWGTVKDIEKRYLKKRFAKIFLRNVSRIGIDEVFMGESIGIKGYLTIVRDLESGAVLFVGKGKKGECLDEFLVKLRRSGSTITTVAVDLAPSFTSWITKNLPSAIIVYDHFHVIKLMNDKLNAIRVKTLKQLEDHEKEELTGMRYNYLMNQEKLTEKASSELELCNSMFSDLGTAHWLKESLRNIYSMSTCSEFAKIAFRRWCELANETGISQLKTMAKTITKHLNGIVAYWDTGLTSASMEGFNNKIGWLTRQAYGYKDEEYLILKIFSLPNVKKNELSPIFYSNS